jgi:hypothetical protein
MKAEHLEIDIDDSYKTEYLQELLRNNRCRELRITNKYCFNTSDDHFTTSMPADLAKNFKHNYPEKLDQLIDLLMQDDRLTKITLTGGTSEYSNDNSRAYQLKYLSSDLVRLEKLYKLRKKLKQNEANLKVNTKVNTNDGADVSKTSSVKSTKGLVKREPKFNMRENLTNTNNPENTNNAYRIETTEIILNEGPIKEGGDIFAPKDGKDDVSGFIIAVNPINKNKYRGDVGGVNELFHKKAGDAYKEQLKNLIDGTNEDFGFIQKGPRHHAGFAGITGSGNLLQPNIHGADQGIPSGM